MDELSVKIKKWSIGKLKWNLNKRYKYKKNSLTYFDKKLDLNNQEKGNKNIFLHILISTLRKIYFHADLDFETSSYNCVLTGLNPKATNCLKKQNVRTYLSFSCILCNFIILKKVFTY